MIVEYIVLMGKKLSHQHQHNYILGGKGETWYFLT